jgi:hypothetical protein
MISGGVNIYPQEVENELDHATRAGRRCSSSSRELVQPRALRLTSLVAALALLSGCGWGVRRLDEHVFHDGPGYRLKVVRYYESLPLHYSGEIYSVQCQSPATRDLEAQPTQDAGWRTLERGGAIGTKQAAELLPRLEGRYLPIDEARLVWLSRLFQVTFDGCGSFASWDPTALPPEQIDPIEKPDHCAPRGTADCRTLDFDGDRAPRYEAVDVGKDGRIRFVARTPAFRRAAALRVTSSDFGRTWEVEPTRRGAPETAPEGGHSGRLPSATLRLSGDVRRGESYEKQLGPGLVFRLVPSREASISGWTISIGPSVQVEGERADYLSVVTPPYRFRNPRDLDTSYGVSARESVAWTPRSFLFVVGEKEYREAAEALSQRLWPDGTTREPVDAAARRHDAVPKARGELRIVESRISAEETEGDPERIDWLKFEVELELPVALSNREAGSAAPRGQGTRASPTRPP